MLPGQPQRSSRRFIHSPRSTTEYLNDIPIGQSCSEVYGPYIEYFSGMSTAKPPTCAKSQPYTWVGDQFVQQTLDVASSSRSTHMADGTATLMHRIQQSEV